MKRFLVIIILFVSALSLFAEDRTWVKLTLADGGEQSFVVPGKMIVCWTPDSLSLSSSLVEVTYARHLVKGYSFSTMSDAESGVDIPELSSGTTLVWESKTVATVYGVAADAIVDVYSTNAVKQTVRVLHSDDVIRIDFSSLVPGIYILCISDTEPIKVKL